MWMQYASQHWTDATDIDTAIERLGSELRCMSFDRLHATNYDLAYCYDDGMVKMLEEESEKYNNGSELCIKYSQNVLNLEQFYQQMIAIGLEGVVKGHLLEFLPYTIRQKYLKHQYITESEDEQDSDDNKNCDGATESVDEQDSDDNKNCDGATESEDEQETDDHETYDKTSQI